MIFSKRMITEKKTSLYQQLNEYAASDAYGFHMPGHKRQMELLEHPYRMDITEIHGFDDLHHPEQGGVLVKAQERAARLYGAEETHFLVNGSTAGILSAISGCTTRNGKILMARNCHRSAYHAAALRNLEISYIYPLNVDKLWINGGIIPKNIEKYLANDETIQMIFVTSPTYDGVCSDIRSIAEICHRFGRPLIVDQAHGAHFPFSEYFPEDAISAGADVVIHSVHKTLPSMTQTALLHMQGDLVDREKIRHYLSVYQSSSPSYVLMASLDSCMEWLEQKGKKCFPEYVKRLQDFREACRDLKKLHLVGEELAGTCGIHDFDRSRLLVDTGEAAVTGGELCKLLREDYHLEMELSAPNYIMGLSSVADTQEGLDRFCRALHELDGELEGKKRNPVSPCKAAQDAGRICSLTGLRIGDAWEREQEKLPFWECVGRTAGDFLYLYPPGIPLLAPGERILPETVEQAEGYRAAGLEVHGLTPEGAMAVIKEG